MRTLAQTHNKPQEKSSANHTGSNTRASATSHEAHHLLHLQRTIGNQAVLRLLKARADGLDSQLTHVIQQTPSLTEQRPAGFASSPVAPETARVALRSPGRISRKKDKTALESEGITGSQTVDDTAKVRSILHTTLSNPNSKLFPYIKNKLQNLKEKTQFNISRPGSICQCLQEICEKTER